MREVQHSAFDPMPTTQHGPDYIKDAACIKQWSQRHGSEARCRKHALNWQATC